MLEIFLENATSQDLGRAFGVNSPHLLDAQFNLKLINGEHHELPHKLAPTDFRYQPGNGVPGYGITTSVEQVSPNVFATNALPINELPRIENPTPEELAMTEGPKFEVLSTNPLVPMHSLIKAISEFEADWGRSIDAMAVAGQVDEAEESSRALKALALERSAIADGVALLEQQPVLLECFCWMNEAMLEAIRLQGKDFDSWRLFQLGFILTQVRAVYERTCDESELTDHLNTAEVLWFSTGGGTPGRITSSFEDHKNSFLPLMNQEKLDELKFISDCPYCKAKHSIVMESDLDNGRIKHVCTNGECWTNTEAAPGVRGEGIRGELGIYVSDEECYRYLPTVMVGTIDKLAVIFHNKRFRYFFGGGKYFCPQHGFSYEGRCEHSRIIKRDDESYTAEQCPNNSRTSLIKTVKVSEMRHTGISFLLQDELHLLKENMGNFDARYETLLF